MKLFSMVENTTGEGKDKKTAFQFAGNVSLVEAQQMLTEILVVTSKADGAKQAEKNKQVEQKEGKEK